jgi:FkbM family methyltransferase
MSDISKLFRILPYFKGKYRIANLALKKALDKEFPISFRGKNELLYTIPNTIENIGKELFINGVYEAGTIKLIRKLLNDQAVFFDIGANIGAISLPLAKQTSASIHAFEPSAFIFDYLKKNVENNHITSILINNVAVHSVHNSQLDFFAADIKYGKSTMVPSYSQTSYPVNTVNLDEYCNEKEISTIDVLKIDVQGFELNVFKGCEALLKRKAIGNIIFEFEDWAETDAGFGEGSSQLYLIDNGYEIFTLRNERIRNIVKNGSHMFWAKPKI